MKVFHCDHCEQPIFFENIRCLRCDHPLAFLPDLETVGSLEAVDGTIWRSPLPEATGRVYRLCRNYDGANVCNWAIAGDDPNQFCRSCRLTRVIPDLSQPGHTDAWYRLEIAKRRLMYSLLLLRLPTQPRAEDPTNGLAFEFLADGQGAGTPRVLTGYADGVITINLAEADEATREMRRVALHEPYRTLLGHFRHEIGHYYWEVLIGQGDRIESFRGLFGDERVNYEKALQNHYNQGDPAGWQERFISVYAGVHPWEDWAETWAHYLHMADTLETAAACGLALHPQDKADPSIEPDPRGVPPASFDRMIQHWFPLTYVLNNLNRGLGLPDGYPFVLSPQVVDKLRFVHETIERAGSQSPYGA